MDKAPYQVDGYGFMGKSEYERALKEKETVSYLMATTDLTDTKALLKIYNRSIEKESFRTVVGLEYMGRLRRNIVKSGVVSAESLAPIPVKTMSRSGQSARADKDSPSVEALKAQVERYKEACESAKTGRVIKNITIFVLVALLAAILFLTYKSQYSVFTYFTNYKEKMRNEVIDEYEEWQSTLEEKEQELEQREQTLQTGK